MVVNTVITDKEKVGMDMQLWLRNEALVASHPPIVDPEAASHCGNMMVTSAPISSTNDDPIKDSEHVPNNAPFERDYDIASMILECVLLLCQTRIIRHELRRRQVYVICRNYDVEVNQDRISDLMNEIVQFLMRDESNDELSLT